MPVFTVFLQLTLLPLHAVLAVYCLLELFAAHTCTNTHGVIYLHEKDPILCSSLDLVSNEKDLSSSNVALRQ